MNYGPYDAPLICLTIVGGIIIMGWMFRDPIVNILETIADLLEERRG
jgi:hypothetical protein